MGGVLGSFLVVGCAKSFKGIPEVTPEMAMAYGVEQETLMSGREVYLANCSKCHERVHPGEIDPEFWRGITPHMAVKAELSKADEEKLLHYLMVAHAEIHGLDPEH